MAVAAVPIARGGHEGIEDGDGGFALPRDGVGVAQRRGG